MSKNLKGTKTEKNLLEALTGESVARNKYLYYAGVARARGYNEVADIFIASANNEREHANVHLINLGTSTNVLENLLDAIKCENYETTDMYPRMAREAREEGFYEIAEAFENIARAEDSHRMVFFKTRNKLTKETILVPKSNMRWQCRSCGYATNSIDPPNICPLCGEDKAYFKEFEY